MGAPLPCLQLRPALLRVSGSSSEEHHSPGGEHSPGSPPYTGSSAISQENPSVGEALKGRRRDHGALIYAWQPMLEVLLNFLL